MSKRSCGAMAVAILAAAGIVASATTASAANNDVETFQNAHTHRCLDDKGNDLQHDLLRGFGCNSEDFQLWS